MYLDLIVFGYICPPESPVRQRMLYSSCRATLISHIENILNFKIDRKVNTLF